MRLQRLAETGRPAVSFMLDGAPVAALEGDSLLTAILAQNGGYLRASEFGDGPRAGFCLMGACQDCWVNVEGGGRVRACTTPIEEGMRVSRGMVRP
ncbi:(2Fe-2S)-binding protein [Bradyrhizobium liaoningense]|uniref:(2Fe-2S)-binding protein n=1 Tax=Bradyrhizobium liaoningense TaxID=43992 RepID=UPI001BA87A8D|nr:(2Fe-2S)-binding protein [Bradyrhizobium liaoningense]MBR0712798.1 (2Fe-2S)-binding protein [Bradyrhizobium liaoningense]